MRIIQANIEAILMDRIPDNCIFDCPFCVPRVVGGEEVEYCPVINELVYDHDDDISEDCPLVYDASDEEKVENS